jgi:hypothetical protein
MKEEKKKERKGKGDGLEVTPVEGYRVLCMR